MRLSSKVGPTGPVPPGLSGRIQDPHLTSSRIACRACSYALVRPQMRPQANEWSHEKLLDAAIRSFRLLRSPFNSSTLECSNSSTASLQSARQVALSFS